VGLIDLVARVNLERLEREVLEPHVVVPIGASVCGPQAHERAAESQIDHLFGSAVARHPGVLRQAEGTEQHPVVRQRSLDIGDRQIYVFGLFIGPDSALTLAGIVAARAGLSTAVGRPSAYQATVWLDDAAAAVAAAVEAPAGVYNVADTDPPRRADVDAALSAAVWRDTLRRTLDQVSRELEPTARSQVEERFARSRRGCCGSRTASRGTSAKPRTSCGRPGCGSSGRARSRSATSTRG
jgi:hypothetical protein